MPICANPKEIIIKIPVGEAAAVLKLKTFTSEEYNKFMDARHKIGRGGKFKNNGNEERCKFIDKLLIGVSAEDESGNPDTVTYINDAGQQEELTPEVEKWKAHISASWKISAALKLEADTQETELVNLKN